MMSGRVLAVVLAIASPLVACPVGAAPSSAILRQAKSMSNEAAHHFKAHRYLKAAELFQQAYALDPDKLVRLRNAGRALEEADRAERALHCFVRYAERETDPKLVADANERILRLKAAIAARRQAEAAKKAAASAPQAPVAPIPAQKPPLTVTAAKRGRGILPWMLGGVGLAALAAGGVWLVATESAAGDVARDDEAGRYEYQGGQEKHDDDRAAIGLNRVASWSVVGLGAAAAGTATWLLLRDESAAIAEFGLDPVGRRVKLAWRF